MWQGFCRVRCNTFAGQMKKTFFILIIVGITALSCNKEVAPLSKKEIKEKVDSIYNLRIKDIDEKAQKDLEYRLKIELKVKVDSILKVKLQQPKIDSTPKKLH